jgi:hypothetical protein
MTLRRQDASSSTRGFDSRSNANITLEVFLVGKPLDRREPV